MIKQDGFCPECDEDVKFWKHANKGWLCVECGYCPRLDFSRRYG